MSNKILSCPYCQYIMENEEGLCDHCGYISEMWDIENEAFPPKTFRELGYFINKKGKKITPLDLVQLKLEKNKAKISYPMATKECVDISLKGKLKNIFLKSFKEDLSEKEDKNLYENIYRVDPQMLDDQKKKNKIYYDCKKRVVLLEKFRRNMKRETSINGILKRKKIFLKETKIDIKSLKRFFDNIDLTIITKNMETYQNKQYKRKALIRFLIFETLSNFRSRKELIRFLEQESLISNTLGFVKGIPTLSTFSIFIKKYGPFKKLIEPVLNTIISNLDDYEI